MIEIKEIDESKFQTSDIENCNNNGCGFNIDGKCTASGTTCFGFMKVEGGGL